MGKSGTVVTLIDRRSEYKLDKYRRDLKIELAERILARGKLLTK